MLRRTTIDDAGELGAIHIASWKETYAGILPEDMLASLSIKARSAVWAKILAEPSAFAETAVYVIEDDTSIVGFGACGRQRDSHLKEMGFDAEISAIYVLRPRQRRGWVGPQCARWQPKFGPVDTRQWSYGCCGRT